MLGNFTYYNPTKLYFGETALTYLKDELLKVGNQVILAYGGGSIKRNGIYDDVMNILKECGKSVAEIPGIMPNPTHEKLYEGLEIARSHRADFILAVGGGSVCDYAKALAVSIHCDEDPWQKYFLKLEEPSCPVVPVGCLLTLAGTGSEMNTGSVIANHEQKLKIGHVFKNPDVFPRFAIMNPRYTMTLPKYQMLAGIFDIFSHICEQYFSGSDDNTSDYISEGLMRSILTASRIASLDPQNYEARSNIMWTATWALNTLVAKGKSTDWMVHMLGHAVSAVTDATHGMTLAAVSLPYYRFIMNDGLAKFVRFAKNVWNVSPENKTDTQIALEGLAAMEAWMREIGLVMRISDLGITADNLEDAVNATLINKGGYRILTKDEVRKVLTDAL